MSKKEPQYLLELNYVSPPPVFRSLVIALKTQQKITEEDHREITNSHEYVDKGLLHNIEYITEFTGKINPLTPYEKEIIETYVQLHVQFGELLSAHDNLLHTIATLTTLMDETRQAFGPLKEMHDNMRRSAILGHKPEEGEDVLIAAIPIDVIEEYNKQAKPIEDNAARILKEYNEWWHKIKAFEKDFEGTQKLQHDFHKMITPFYDEQERFTLHCNTFHNDYEEYIKAVNKQNKQIAGKQNTINDFAKCYESYSKAEKEFLAHISDWNPNDQWRSSNN